jgi:hypothetical protein
MALVLALALGAGVSLGAQTDEVWLLLTSGERVDGVVTTSQARGGFGQFFDRNGSGFTVSDGSGRPTRIPMSEVALVDFTTTRPTAAELASLPATGQLLVLDDGSTRAGELVALSGGTVRWQPVRGPAITVPVRSVRRIYLDLDRSYELAQHASPWGQRRGLPWARGRSGQPAGQPGGVNAGKSGDPSDDRVTGGKSGSASGGGSKSGSNAGGEITVLADQPWTDTGLNVRVGQTLRFEADGRILFTRGNENVTGPDGAHEAGPRFPVPAMGVGGLIGKIGPTGRPFAIGSQSGPIRMPANGRLMLGVNDDHYDDNDGAFRVRVIR